MKFLLNSFLLAAFAATASADLTLSQKVEQEGQTKGDMVITLKIKDGKVRMDAGTQMSTLIDNKTGDMQTLMHDQKMVMSVPSAMLKALQQMAHQQVVGDTNKVEPPQATGRKETINGFACEEYETTLNGSKMTMWLTKDLPEAEKALKQLESLSSQSDMFKGLADHPEVPGFPMRSTVVGPDGKTTTISVVALSEKPLPATDFSVPAGYKTMEMPSLPGR